MLKCRKEEEEEEEREGNGIGLRSDAPLSFANEIKAWKGNDQENAMRKESKKRDKIIASIENRM